MNPILRNILAVVAGVLVGSAVNMALVMNANVVIPLPENIDPSNMESIKMHMHLYQPEHFIMPFLAHALGSLVGAFVIAKLAASKNMVLALGMGAWFLIGGIVMAVQLPAPMWFEVCDVVIAYIPMAYLGVKLAGKA